MGVGFLLGAPAGRRGALARRAGAGTSRGTGVGRNPSGAGATPRASPPARGQDPLVLEHAPDEVAPERPEGQREQRRAHGGAEEEQREADEGPTTGHGDGGHDPRQHDADSAFEKDERLALVLGVHLAVEEGRRVQVDGDHREQHPDGDTERRRGQRQEPFPVVELLDPVRDLGVGHVGEVVDRTRPGLGRRGAEARARSAAGPGAVGRDIVGIGRLIGIGDLGRLGVVVGIGIGVGGPGGHRTRNAGGPRGALRRRVARRGGGCRCTLQVGQSREEALPDRQFGWGATEGVGVVVGHRCSLKVHTRISKVLAPPPRWRRPRTCSPVPTGVRAHQHEPRAQVVLRLDDPRRSVCGEQPGDRARRVGSERVAAIGRTGESEGHVVQSSRQAAQPGPQGRVVARGPPPAPDVGAITRMTGGPAQARSTYSQVPSGPGPSATRRPPRRTSKSPRPSSRSATAWVTRTREAGGSRRAVGNPSGGGRLPRVGGLGQLDDDAGGLARVEERLFPVGVGEVHTHRCQAHPASLGRWLRRDREP